MLITALAGSTSSIMANPFWFLNTRMTLDGDGKKSEDVNKEDKEKKEEKEEKDEEEGPPVPPPVGLIELVSFS